MIHSAAPIAVPDSAPKPSAEKSSGWDFSFDNLLDIVNPLHHFPIVGTLYRAITGDQIEPQEKIAGGALFGGLWGLVSSVADTAFEAITGKDFGSTVLALFTGDKKETVLASTSAPAAAAQMAPAADTGALLEALSIKGVDADTARRAAYAYNQSMSMAEAGALR